METAQNQELLTTCDIAKRLKTTRLFVAKLIREGHLKAFRYGKREYRIEEGDYQKFIKGRKDQQQKHTGR